MRKPAVLCLLAFLLLAACAKDEIAQVPEEPSQPQEQPQEPQQPPVPVGMGTDLLSFSVQVGGKTCDAFCPSGKEVTVIVPKGTDLKHLVPVFTHNAHTVTVKDVPQESGVTENDFSAFRFGLTYRLTSLDGKTMDYTVRVIDTQLPVVAVTTVEPGKIKSKTVWRDAGIKILNTDGTVSDLGATQIRGRGNWTWDKYPKKPYALKLGTKQPVMGMPAHKRWCLLALYRGFIGNPLMFEATRRAPALGWAPRGQFVELVLNGKFQGLYYLCEQIKIDENRVNITKLKETDVTYPAVSGGYLLEYDEVFDEPYKFTSGEFGLPVQLKSPDENVPDAQFNYIKGFINDMEKELKKIGKEESRYTDYLDMENFAEYWMVLESITNYEAYKPRSVKMYKGRDGVDSPKGTVCKLKAGPLWDQELFLVDHTFNTRDAHYFKYLFRDPAFVAAVKEHWKTYKSNLLGNDRYKRFVDYLNEDIVALIDGSAQRDLQFWGNDYFTFEDEVATVRKGFESKIQWMDGKINSF